MGKRELPEFTTRHLIIWFAVVLHLVQGTLMILSPDAGFVTSTAHVREWVGVSALTLGIVYVLGAGCAALGLILCQRLSVPRVLSLFPQQMLLTLAAAGAVVAIAQSQFADGVIRSRYFIGSDQCPIILLAVFHSGAILQGRVGVLWNRWHSR